MDDNDGRGARKVADTLGAYIPSPTTFSGFLGGNVVVESDEGTSVCEDRDVDERHLKDISENIGYCLVAVYGSISGSSESSVTTPNRWARKGSSVLWAIMNRARETMLDNISIDPRLEANLSTHNANKLAALVLLCTAQERPMSMLESPLVALGEQLGCLASVKVTLKPLLMSQTITLNRRAIIENHCTLALIKLLDSAGAVFDSAAGTLWSVT